jgi:heme-degrading monooxygenase HmoA
MVKHIIGWDFADGFTEEENQKHVAEMKKELEGLIDKIEGILTIQLITNPIDTSDAKILLYSEFESEEALKAYTIHPEHVRVANTYVRPFVKNRRCFDFLVS